MIVAVAAAVFIAVRSRNRILQVVAAAAIAHSGRLYLYAADRRRAGRLADRFLHQYALSGPRPGPWRWPCCPWRDPCGRPTARAWRTLLFLVAVYAITVLTTPRWYPSYIVGTIFLTLALVWAPAGLGTRQGTAQRQPRRRRRRGGRAFVLLAVLLGRAQETQYYHHHYTEVDHFLQEGGPKKAFTFARKLQNKRIGLAGSGEIFFGQYGYYGENLNNYVQYIGMAGRTGPGGCRKPVRSSAA